MTTIKQERQRIKRLVEQDQQNSNQIDSFYQQAMRIVSSHLQDFYEQYADDNGLTTAQVSQQSSGWDFMQYQQAVNELMANKQPDSDLSRQLQLLQVQATATDRKGTLAAIIGAGIAVATDNTKSFAHQKMGNEYHEGYGVRNPQQLRAPNAPGMADFDNALNGHAQQATAKAQQQLYKNLQTGIKRSDFRHLTKVVSESDDRENDNLASAVNTEVSGIQSAFVTESSKINSQGAKDAMSANNVKYAYFLTQNDDKVCQICEEAASDNPYELSSTPTPPIHINCRCQLVPCDKDGNLIGDIDNYSLE